MRYKSLLTSFVFLAVSISSAFPQTYSDLNRTRDLIASVYTDIAKTKEDFDNQVSQIRGIPKGEFEKTTDFNSRIDFALKELTSKKALILAEKENRLSQLLSEQYIIPPSFYSVMFGAYNPDEEYFPCYVKIHTPEIDAESVEFLAHVTISDAQEFKKNITSLTTVLKYTFINGIDFQIGFGSLFLSFPSFPSAIAIEKAKVSSVSTGENYSMFIKTDGSLWGVGDNFVGQLGDGTTESRTTPIKVMMNVKSVSIGNRFTMILKRDGTLWAVGDINSKYSEKGSNHIVSPPVLVPIQIMADVQAVSTGDSHTMIIKNDGTLWAMGDNHEGQLCNGEFGNFYSFPIKVQSDVISVSAGDIHSIFLKNDGTLWGAGGNAFGQIGNGGSMYPQANPRKLMTNVKTISARANFSLIIKEDQSLWGVGDNGWGQLGNGTSGLYNKSLYPIPLMENIELVSAGHINTAVIRQDSSLWVAGCHGYDQSNEYSAMDTDTFIKIMDNAKTVSAGRKYTMIVLSDGSLWGFGANTYGQLGDGTKESKAMPVCIIN